MSQNLRRLAAILLFLLVIHPTVLAAQTDDGDENIIDVMGKVVDHDYFETPFGKIYLPRILLADGELYVYANTQSAIESGEFISEDGVLVKADGTPITLDFSITSHLLYVWFGFLLSILVTAWAASRYKRGIGAKVEPKGAFHNIFEVVFVFVRDDIAKEFIPQNKHLKYIPYLFSIFLGISFMNLFGLLPWAVSATADLTVTATLAGITFFITQFSGSKDHWEHVFLYPGVPVWTRFILTPVEILGLFTKPLALAIRLFANMLSGKIMIVAILGLIFIFADLFGSAVGYGTSVFWVALTAGLYFLKALVALIQAYVFTLLSAVFIGMAVEEHHHDESHKVSASTSVVSTVE